MALLPAGVEQIESVENWIAEAERYGKVEIGYATMSNDREVRISAGKWGNCYVQLWGRGYTIEAAAKRAVEKARAFGDILPPHPHDC